MKTQTYTISMAIVLASTIIASMSVGNSIVLGTSDDSNGDDDDDEDSPCYNAGFEAGRGSGLYNQTQETTCSNTGFGHAYYEGFISGCISSGGGDYFACDSKTDK